MNITSEQLLIKIGILVMENDILKTTISMLQEEQSNNKEKDKIKK